MAAGPIRASLLRARPAALPGRALPVPTPGSQTDPSWLAERGKWDLEALSEGEMLGVAGPFLPKSKIIQKLEESCGFEFVSSRIILFCQPGVLVRLGCGVGVLWGSAADLAVGML